MRDLSFGGANEIAEAQAGNIFEVGRSNRLARAAQNYSVTPIKTRLNIFHLVFLLGTAV
jgi:hypothetical protein